MRPCVAGALTGTELGEGMSKTGSPGTPRRSRTRIEESRPGVETAGELLLQQFLDAVLEFEHHRYGVAVDPVGLAVETDMQRVEQLGVDRVALVGELSGAPVRTEVDGARIVSHLRHIGCVVDRDLLIGIE